MCEMNGTILAPFLFYAILDLSPHSYLIFTYALMRKYFLFAILFFGSLFVTANAHAACDAKGLVACQAWAQKQISDIGCRAPQPAFDNAVADLYLGAGCRIQGVKWFQVQSGAVVQGGFSGGVNIDSAGCIARYTPGGYLATGGYFRTPKEAMNGSLRNKSLSGCAYDSDLGKKDASVLTAPIIAQIESCSCAGQSAAPAPTPAKGGGGGAEAGQNPSPAPAPANQCSQNKEFKGGECVCKAGFTEADDLSCIKQCPAEKHFTRKSKTECGCAQLYRMSSDKTSCDFSSGKGFTFDVDSQSDFQDTIEKLDRNEGVFFDGTLASGKKVRVGILRLPDGSYVFTGDGRHYFADPQKAIVPGVFTRMGEGLENSWNGLKMFFGIGKYTGKGTDSNNVNQDDGQKALDAAIAVQKQLDADLGDPEKQIEIAKGIEKDWQARMKKSVTSEYSEQLFKDLQSATGIDAATLKKLYKGDNKGVRDDLLDKFYESVNKQTGVDLPTIKQALRGDTSSVGVAALDQLAVQFQKQTGVNSGVVKKVLSGNYKGIGSDVVDAVFDGIKKESGVDIPIIRQVFKGDVAALKSDIMSQLTTFPGQSVIILAKELRSASFANAVRIYIADRESGKTTADIQASPSPELDYVSSVQGVSQQYVRGGLFSAYEEAYQRYLLAKKF